ncbi:hypothetical protein BZ163_25070, partial [Pseudomonas sp. VI4.1]
MTTGALRARPTGGNVTGLAAAGLQSRLRGVAGAGEGIVARPLGAGLLLTRLLADLWIVWRALALLRTGLSLLARLRTGLRLLALLRTGLSILTRLYIGLRLLALCALAWVSWRACALACARSRTCGCWSRSRLAAWARSRAWRLLVAAGSM